MKFGTTIRNMGPAATRGRIVHAAECAESLGLDHIWVVDHVAIPPDDAEGSEGRWIDPLAMLAFLSAATRTIELGVSILVLPYRPALLTAKWIASIQELCGERLYLGVGAGWMEAEFQALGLDRRQRGRTTDEAIQFIRSCFDASDDVVEAHGQPFLFRPRPQRPPIFVGGMSDAALKRAATLGDGWIPMGINPEKLAGRYEKLRALAEAVGRPCPEVVVIGSLPDDQALAVQQLGQCKELGVTHYIQSSRYVTEHEFDALADRVADLKKQLGD